MSQKGQVTFPSSCATGWGIRPGELLDVEEQGGRLIARKADSSDAVDVLYGILDLPARPDVLLDELRGPGPTP